MPAHRSRRAPLVFTHQAREARAAARAALTINPQLTIPRFRAFFDTFTDNPINNAGRDRIIEAVRKAGVPE
jgi:hypothetical protein